MYSHCNYTFMWNLLDYTAGVVPVTHVDRKKDALPKNFSLRGLNGVAQGAMKLYDADKMHGLPVAVQIVGRRLEEEKVLAYMVAVEEALDKKGGKYQYPILARPPDLVACLARDDFSRQRKFFIDRATARLANPP